MTAFTESITINKKEAAYQLKALAQSQQQSLRKDIEVLLPTLQKACY